MVEEPEKNEGDNIGRDIILVAEHNVILSWLNAVILHNVYTHFYLLAGSSVFIITCPRI